MSEQENRKILIATLSKRVRFALEESGEKQLPEGTIFLYPLWGAYLFDNLLGFKVFIGDVLDIEIALTSNFESKSHIISKYREATELFPFPANMNL